MSVILLPFVDAPALQISLNEIYRRIPMEASPELQFLTSAENTNRVLETAVVPGNTGHIRQVQVIYTPRITEAEVSTTITTDCSKSGEAGDLITTYQIDTTVGVEYGETVNLSDLKARLQTNPEYFAERAMQSISAVRRKLATGVANQMVLLNGRFAHDNGEEGLSNGNYLKTVATKYPVALDGGKVNPQALQEIIFSSVNSGFAGKPYVFGFGEVMRYFSLLDSSGEYSSSGLNFMKFFEANSVGFMPSIRIHTALNGTGSTNNFLVVDAGAIHLLQYNKYDDPSAQVSQENLVMGVVTDPMTGTSFNYKFYLNPCGETITYIFSTSYQVVGLPDDMYAGGDRLEETNGVLQFAITNS